MRNALHTFFREHVPNECVCPECVDKGGFKEVRCRRHKCGWPHWTLWLTQYLGWRLVLVGTVAGLLGAALAAGAGPVPAVTVHGITETSIGEMVRVDIDAETGGLVVLAAVVSEGEIYANGCKQAGGACFVVPAGADVGVLLLGAGNAPYLLCAVCLPFHDVAAGETFFIPRHVGEMMAAAGLVVVVSAVVVLAGGELAAWRTGKMLEAARLVGLLAGTGRNPSLSRIKNWAWRVVCSRASSRP